MQPSFRKDEHNNMEDFSSPIHSMNQPQIQQSAIEPKLQQLFSPQHHNFLAFYPQEQEHGMANFKIGLREDDMNREGVGTENHEEDDNDLVHGVQQYFPLNRPTSLELQPHYWPPQEDSAFKQPFWKSSYTDLLNSQNKLYNEAEYDKELLEKSQNKQHALYSEQVLVTTTEQMKNVENKCRFFGDLESIYEQPHLVETNLRGCLSDVTDKNMPKNLSLQANCNDFHQLNAVAGSCGGTNVEADHESDAEEASILEVQKRKKRKILEGEMDSTMTDVLGKMMKQLMDHQECLHKKFLETIEKIEHQRNEREEAWRREDLAKAQAEANARAHEQALAASREATIISYLEKITGQSISFPPWTTSSQFNEELKPSNISKNENISTTKNKRWPKADVEALIHARTNLEPKFHDPGLKWTVWEEISSAMASMGYQRSAQRCKEKWENINRYFRKVKENSKQFPHKQHKSCSYFQLLDQLYSKSLISGPTSSPNIVDKSSELGSHGLSFDGFIADEVQGFQECSNGGKDADKYQVYGDKDEDVDEDGEEEEEGTDSYSDGGNLEALNSNG